RLFSTCLITLLFFSFFEFSFLRHIFRQCYPVLRCNLLQWIYTSVLVIPFALVFLEFFFYLFTVFLMFFTMFNVNLRNSRKKSLSINVNWVLVNFFTTT